MAAVNPACSGSHQASACSSEANSSGWTVAGTGSSVSLAAAAALLGEDEDAVADALDVLVDAHLLELRAPDRYRFHDLLRVYAAERARTQETEQTREAAVIRVLA